MLMLGPFTERGRRPRGGGESTGDTRERKLEEERSSLGAPGEVLGVERSSYGSPTRKSGKERSSYGTPTGKAEMERSSWWRGRKPEGRAGKEWRT